MNIHELERLAFDVYKQLTNIDVSNARYPNTNRDFVLQALASIDARTTFLLALDKILQELSVNVSRDVLERLNNIYKELRIRNELNDYGGLFIPARDFDLRIEQDFRCTNVVPYEVVHEEHGDFYRLSGFGSAGDIVEPTSVRVIYGEGTDYQYKVKIHLSDSADSIFVDVAGCDVALLYHDREIQLVDGYNNFGLPRGEYTFIFKPKLVGTSFYMMIRSLIFTKGSHYSTKFIYTKDIDFDGSSISIYGGHGTIELRTDDAYHRAKDRLSICETSTHSVVIDHTSNPIGHTVEPVSGRGYLTAPLEVHPVLFLAVCHAMVEVNRDIELPELPEHFSMVVGRIADRMYEYGDGILRQGLYYIRVIATRSFDETLDELCSRVRDWVGRFANHSLYIPVHVIDGDIYSELPRIETERLLWLPRSELQLKLHDSHLAGRLQITSGTPIGGVLIQ